MKTQVFTLFSSSPNNRDLAQIALALNNGAVMIYPTDTVYALGCLSNNAVGLDKLARLKNIKLEKAPLSFLFEDISELSNYVKPFDAKIFRLLKSTLPGPYAFVMEAVNKLPKPFQKRKTIGVRISDHPILKALLSHLDAPLLTSSLHDKDEILFYTSDPDAILSAWDGKVDLLIHAGPCGNIPSSVIDLTTEPFTVIREGKGEIDFI
jgi:tRNA threonylcarbamoyl adenosine modification protein (Sua5/YciO/YrdC/YwlC family)